MMLAKEELMSTEEQIKKLEKLMLSEDLEELNLSTNKFNIFTALKLHNNEIRHSNFLGWLMAPYENHGVGDYFLKEFLKESIKNFSQTDKVTLSLSDIAYADFSDCEIRREHENIDILLTSNKNKFLCVIENKIWTGEHDEQLERYAKYVNENFADYNKIYIYLTPNIETDKLIQKEYKNSQNQAEHIYYIPMNYEQVYGVINKTLKFKSQYLNDEVKIFIKHYRNMIERKIMRNEDEKVTELCRKIYRENKEAIDLIIEKVNSTSSRIADILREIVAERNDIVAEENNKDKYIRCIPAGVDTTKLKFGSEKALKSKLAVVIELTNHKDQVLLQLSINPADEKHQAEHTKLVNFLQEKLGVDFKNFAEWKFCNIAELISAKDYADVTCLEDSEIKAYITEKINKSNLIPNLEKVLNDFVSGI